MLERSSNGIRTPDDARMYLSYDRSHRRWYVRVSTARAEKLAFVKSTAPSHLTSPMGQRSPNWGEWCACAE